MREAQEAELLALGENPWTDHLKERERYYVDNEEWRYDAYPEILDGRNVADFIDPDGDWIGGFAVGIHGIEPHLARFQAEHDDYSDILLKALADRFAEAFAERLHQHVRTALWGYAPGNS